MKKKSSIYEGQIDLRVKRCPCCKSIQQVSSDDAFGCAFESETASDESASIDLAPRTSELKR
jgi:hypothetical protein